MFCIIDDSVVTVSNSPRAALRTALLASAIALGGTQAAHAQQEEGAEALEEAFEGDTIVIEGQISRSIEDSLQAKRSLDVIGDAIIGGEVGDLPDLSVAETLERVVGVTSDRFKGGASELSVRGLGAFLGSSFFNGREISSGSDGRDVNFGQFPSELINGAIIYKSQQASFIEGGVSGIIELQTLRPLDYGKQRIQAQFLGGYSEYEDRVVGSGGLNYRVTGSYVDQFETGLGDIGISIGGQIRRDTAPEDIYTSSSTYRPCNTIEGVDQSNNCAFDRDDDGNPSGASEPYFVSNQYIYRAQETDADRDAVIGAIQWQPTTAWDINLDAQYSYRSDEELRHNLVIADGRRDIAPIEISPTGALLAYSGETRLENQSVFRVREEDYLGLGGNVKWSGDALSLGVDVSYSRTNRDQDELDMRIRTNDRVDFILDFRGFDVPELTLTDVSDVEDDTGLTFDLDNHDLYTNGARARRRLETVDDEIFAVRFDGEYEFGGNFLRSVQFGARYGDRHRVNDDGIDENVDILNGYDSDEVRATRRGNFPIRDLFVGADTPMQGLTYATWNPVQLFTALTGSPDAGLPEGSTLSPQDADITEKTYAGYVQANFDTAFGDMPASGNVGVRVIRTEITSLGVSSALESVTDPDDPTIVRIETVGDPIVNAETNDFWNFLPSANLSIELSEDKLLRFAAYRAIARPDPGSLSAALDFVDDDDGAGDDVGSIIRASGNPFLDPLESWNADVSFEWYASKTSSLSLAAYYKSLQTGFENVTETLTVQLDGTPTDVVIGRVGNSDDSSTLYGFEIAAQHKFDGGFLNGFGVQASYNFADSDFEFPDPVVVSGEAIADFTEPANIPGYSKHTGNATVFWENDRITLRAAYKYRSRYFKPFRVSQNRYTKAQDFVDLSASFDINKNLEVRAQVLNLFDEPNIFYRPTRDSLAQTDYSGRRYFLGLRGRF
ncbi:MAG: TonB-dependent receptor [Pacificimonas sp.]